MKLLSVVIFRSGLKKIKGLFTEDKEANYIYNNFNSKGIVIVCNIACN